MNNTFNIVQDRDQLPQIALQSLEEEKHIHRKTRSLAVESPKKRRDSVVSNTSRRQNFSVPRRGMDSKDGDILKKLLEVADKQGTDNVSELLQVTEDKQSKKKNLRKK